MKTIISIGGVAYEGDALAAAGFVTLGSLRRTVEGPDQFNFTLMPCCTTGFAPGQEVRLTTTDDDGSNPVLRFVGDLPRARQRVTNGAGWVHDYSCPGIADRANKVTILASDGTGTAQFNLAPQDDEYDQSLAGLTVGQIVQMVLEAPDVRAALAEVGIGQFTPAGHLPDVTTSDLAALAIVPPDPVQLGGQAVLAILTSFVQQWHPQYALWVEPTGVIRVRSINSFPPTTLYLPSDRAAPDGSAHPIGDLDYEIDTGSCYTRYEAIGIDGDLFYGSVRLGTLAPAWSKQDQAAWTIRNFTQPGDSTDQGTVSNLTPTSCTLHSDYPQAHWDAQYWPKVGGSLMLVDSTLGAYLTNSEERTITSCTAMTAGGTCDITWDASQPIGSSTYNHYRIEGLNSPKALVGRLYDIRDPATGDVGLKTYVGAHLRNRIPRPLWYGNSSARSQITTAAAKVQWSADGKPPYYEAPIPLEVVRATGQVRLTQPAVQLSATPNVLQNGYPPSLGAGAPYDVIAAIPYSKGQLIASAPTGPGYSGTAFTQFGIQRTRKLPVETFIDRGAMHLMQQLAAEKLACFENAVVTGSFTWQGTPAAFDAMQLGYAVALAVPDYPLPIAGLPLPVRSVTWTWDGGAEPTTSFEFSTLQRPFEGDDLFIHPSYANRAFGAEVDFGGGDHGDLGDLAGYGDESGGAEAGHFAEGEAEHGRDFMSDWRPGRAAKPSGPSRQERIDQTRDDVRHRAPEPIAESFRKLRADGKAPTPAMGPLQVFDDAPKPNAIRVDEPAPRALADQPQRDKDRDVFGEEA